MKHMKLKTLAAAVLAIGASSAFATTAPTACNAASTADVLVNTCTPDIEMYVGGSSALAPALTATIPADLFDPLAPTGITIVHDAGSPNGILGQVNAWYGTAATGLGTAAGKKLFVVYNKQNGSAAGISQLLSTIKDTTIPEQDVVTIGPISKTAGVVASTQALSTGGPNNCTLGADTTVSGITYHNVTCTTHARTQADVGIADVRPDLLFALEGAKPKALTTLKFFALANQGFGVAANANLYNAMQAVQKTDGRIPSSCVVGDLTAACQPTISRAEYASLISTTGGIKSAAQLLGNSDTTVLTLSRRDDLSGSQASSNIYFAENSCLNNVTPGKTTLIKGVLGGELDILGSPAPAVIVNPVYTSPDGKLVVNDQNASSSVITDLTSTTGYTIGVVTLNSAEPTRTPTSWKFLKLGGVSPNFNADGTLADHQRAPSANGQYDFVVTSYAAVDIKPLVKTSVVATYPTVVAALIGTGPATYNGGLSDSTLHNLEGMAYLDGAADPSVLDGSYKQSHYFHTNGNSCSPLIHN